jgi:hypothetical protein
MRMQTYDTEASANDRYLHNGHAGPIPVNPNNADHASDGAQQNGSASREVADGEMLLETRTKVTFQSPFGACNFIVTWNGEDVRDLLDAIQFARDTGDRFIQDKLIEYILNIPFRHPRPQDIPAFVGKPVWAVDNKGKALIGMPGSETIVNVNTLRSQLKPEPGART